MSGFNDPVAGGGGSLVRPSIHSPNYVTGSAGWSINKDGSAEFSNGVFRGTVTGSTFQGTTFVINAAGAFFYNGTPGLGNLICSIAAAAGTDQYGNAYSGVFNAGNQQGAHFGVDSNGTVYVVNSANQNVIMLNPSKQALFVYSGTPASGNLIVSIAATAGTDTVGNAYPQGLSVTAGTIKGATISTSTFLGSTTITNSSGAFYYSGTPAAGNLIASIAPVGGTDSFGNHYPAGFMSQSGETDGSSFANLFDGNLFLGQVLSGSQDTANAALLTQVVTSALLGIMSPITASLPSAGELRLLGGQSTVNSGNANAPKAFFLSGDLSSDLDVGVSGAVMKATKSGAFYTWQTMGAAAGYTVVTGKYRRDSQDNLYAVGEIDQTTGVTGAGAAVCTTAAAAEYRPKTAYRVPCAWLSSGSTFKGAGCVQFNTDGTLTLFWPATTANGDKFQFSALVPLGNIS